MRIMRHHVVPLVMDMDVVGLAMVLVVLSDLEEKHLVPNTMLHGVIPNSKGMSRLNSNSKELQRPNLHLVEQIDIFQLLPNNWM